MAAHHVVELMANVEHKTVIDGGMHLQHTGDMGRMGVRGAWERHYSGWHARDRLPGQEDMGAWSAWVHGRVVGPYKKYRSKPRQPCQLFNICLLCEVPRVYALPCSRC